MSTSNESSIQQSSLLKFCWRISASHTIAYSIAGLTVLIVMKYKDLFASETIASFMRPINSTWVAIGPTLQIGIGVALALILYPIKDALLKTQYGFWKILLLIFGFCLFVPEVPGPGSIEGMIYTKIPFKYHLIGLPETIIYSLLFSFFVWQWNRSNKKRWNVIMTVGLILVALMSFAGYAASIGIIKN